MAQRFPGTPVEQRRRFDGVPVDGGDARARAVGQGIEAGVLNPRSGTGGPTLAGGGLALGRNIAQAFNQSDEVIGGLASALGGSGREAAETERQRVQTQRREQPVATAIQEIGSSALLATPATGARTALATGAAFGGLAGAGSGETAEERARNMLLGAGFGATTAGLLDRTPGTLAAVFRGVRNSPLGRGIQRLASGQRRNLTGAQRRAVSELRRAFRDDGIDAQTARERLRQLAESDFENPALLDIAPEGGNVERVIRAAGTRGGEAGQGLVSNKNDVVSRQAERVGNILARRLSPDENFQRTFQEAMRSRAARAAPLYDEFRGSEPLPVGALADRGFTEAPAFQRAAREAIEQAGNELDANDARLLRRALRGGDLSSVEPDTTIPPAALDRIKRRLDAQIGVARRQGDMDAARQVSQLKRSFTDFLDERYPVYAEARQTFAGDTELINALQAGRQAMRGDVEELESLVGAMSESEREMFRMGLVRAVSERAERVQEGSRALFNGLIRREDVRRRLRLAFDSDESFETFVNALSREDARTGAARAVAPNTGSQTQPRAADVARDEAGNVIKDVLNFQFGDALGRIGSGVARIAGGARRAMTDREMVRLATQASQADEATQQLVLQQVERELGQETADRLRQMIVRGSGPAALVTTNEATQ